MTTPDTHSLDVARMREIVTQRLDDLRQRIAALEADPVEKFAAPQTVPANPTLVAPAQQLADAE